jgi:hypothetical protein
MQKIATKVFIIASVVFGIAGILLILTTPEGVGDGKTALNIFLMKTMQVSGFTVLTSFALSVASKYLNGGK